VFYEDSEQYTLMSYFSANTTHAAYGTASAATPLLYDIAAIQRLYGANMTTRKGDNIYGFNANAGQAFSITGADQQIVFSVWDAGGRDVLDFSGYDETQWINLNEEAFSSVGGLRNNISIARNVMIEDAYGGSGVDSILGSAGANLLRGNTGADTLDGGAGNDTLEGGAGSDSLGGGAGNDLYVNVAGADQVHEATDGGADTLIATSSLSFPANIEFVVIAQGAEGISITGSTANDMIIGNQGANTMSGDAGHDTLNGFGGDDRIFGGEGNDLLLASIGAATIDGGAGDDVILIGDTSLAAILALFAPA
jgi:serralysin